MWKTWTENTTWENLTQMKEHNFMSDYTAFHRGRRYLQPSPRKPHIFCQTDIFKLKYCFRGENV